MSAEGDEGSFDIGEQHHHRHVQRAVCLVSNLRVRQGRPRREPQIAEIEHTLGGQLRDAVIGVDHCCSELRTHRR